MLEKFDRICLEIYSDFRLLKAFTEQKIEPFVTSENVTGGAELAPLDMFKKERWATLPKIFPRDFGHFQVRIDFGVNTF